VKLLDVKSVKMDCVNKIKEIIESNQREHPEYQWVFDFKNIQSVDNPNVEAEFLKIISTLKNVRVANTDIFFNKSDIASITIDNDLDYRSAFKLYGSNYLLDKDKKCLEEKGYTTQTGVTLCPYINVKKIVNDSCEILRWCYIMADGIYEHDRFRDRNSEKITLFSHTMNGSFIAGLLSQFLGYNIMFVDHLGPYNRLNKFDSYRGNVSNEGFIIVSDVVCQGNEFLRAKNIVEYIGGTVKGSTGIVELAISDVLLGYEIRSYALSYSPEEAKNKLGYIIKTKLCDKDCSNCK
jgi:hypothetical protein